MKPIGMIDGKIIELDENVVPMEDRGHQFGDGVYEVTKVYNGRCFALEPHLKRLQRSLREIKIDSPYTIEQLTQFHQKLLEESSITEGGIYLQITRGVSPRAHGFPDSKKYPPRLTMSIRPAAPVNPDYRKNGVKVIMIPDERWLRCDIKSLNLLPNVLGKQKSSEAGCYEAVMIRDGFVTEGTSSNFSVVKDGTVYTYPANNLILNGITRTIAFETLAPSLGIPVVEQMYNEEFMFNAQEAFLTGTTTEIMPVVMAGNKKIGNGQVGPVTSKLQAAYTKLIDKECQR